MGRRISKAQRDKYTFYGVIVLLLLLGGIMLGIIPVPFSATTSEPSDSGGGDTEPVATTTTCDSATGQPVKVAVRNAQNDSDEFLGNNLYLVKGNDIIATGTATAGATLSYTTLTAGCKDTSLEVIANPSTSLVGATKTVSLDGDGTQVVLSAAKSAIPAVTIYDVDRTTNLSTTDDTDGTVTPSSAHALSKGDTWEFFIKVRMTTAASQFGGTISNKAWLIGWKNPNTQKYTNNDMKLSVFSGGVTLSEVDCTDYPNAAQALDLDRCWIVNKAIGDKDSDASNAVGSTLWLSAELGASQGDPGATDDSILYFVDIHKFYDSSYDDEARKIITDGFSNTYSDIGETNVQLTLDVS